jgi:hypothetical protein
MTAMSTQPPTPPTSEATPAPSEAKQQATIIVIAIVCVLLIAGLITGAVVLVNNPVVAAAWRDVFIIFMALEFMVIGVALVILIVQLAVLTNMLKHEIKPILESTNETVNTVRGTTLFVSENLVEPIMKLNSYVAGLSSFMDSISAFTGLGRKK